MLPNRLTAVQIHAVLEARARWRDLNWGEGWENDNPSMWEEGSGPKGEVPGEGSEGGGLSKKEEGVGRVAAAHATSGGRLALKPRPVPRGSVKEMIEMRSTSMVTTKKDRPRKRRHTESPRERDSSRRRRRQEYERDERMTKIEMEDARYHSKKSKKKKGRHVENGVQEETGALSALKKEVHEEEHGSTEAERPRSRRTSQPPQSTTLTRDSDAQEEEEAGSSNARKMKPAKTLNLQRKRAHSHAEVAVAVHFEPATEAYTVYASSRYTTYSHAEVAVAPTLNFGLNL